MYVEDLLQDVSARLRDDADPINDVLRDAWWRKFTMSVSERTESGYPLTTAQTKYVLKLIRDIGPKLVEEGELTDHQFRMMLHNPSYRNNPVESLDIPRDVRVLAGNILGFRCKNIPEITEAINDLVPKSERKKGHPFSPTFLFDHKIRSVPLTPANCGRVADIIGTYGFSYDQKVEDAITRVTEVSTTSMKATLREDHISITPNGIIVERWIDDVMLGDGFVGYLSATPSVARLLVRLAAVMNLELDPEIVALAQDPYPLDFSKATALPSPLTFRQIQAIQFATDMSLRCVFAEANLRAEALLSVWMNGHVPIVVTNLERRTQWRNAAIDLGIHADVVDQVTACSAEFQKERRTRPIIIDMPHVKDTAEALSIEFPKTIMIGDAFGDADFRTSYRSGSMWRAKSLIPLMSSILYPTMPSHEFLTKGFGYEKGLALYGLKASLPADIAFLFGVFIPSPEPVSDDL
jgi:hypothetical protein